MKTKIQVILSCLLGLSSVSFAQSSISKWQAQPIVIDGDRADWVNIPRFFDSQSNVQYEFRNDAQNLFLPALLWILSNTRLQIQRKNP